MGSRNLKNSSVGYLKELCTGAGSILRNVWAALLRMPGQIRPSASVKTAPAVVYDHDADDIFVQANIEELPHLVEHAEERPAEATAAKDEGQYLFEELPAEEAVPDIVHVQETRIEDPALEVEECVQVVTAPPVIDAYDDFLPVRAEPQRRVPGEPVTTEPVPEIAEERTDVMVVQEALAATDEIAVPELPAADEAVEISVTADHDSLITASNPINVIIDLDSFTAMPNPINVIIDLDSFATLSNPINVIIDLDSFTAHMEQAETTAEELPAVTADDVVPADDTVDLVSFFTAEPVETAAEEPPAAVAEDIGRTDDVDLISFFTAEPVETAAEEIQAAIADDVAPADDTVDLASFFTQTEQEASPAEETESLSVTTDHDTLVIEPNPINVIIDFSSFAAETGTDGETDEIVTAEPIPMHEVIDLEGGAEGTEDAILPINAILDHDPAAEPNVVSAEPEAVRTAEASLSDVLPLTVLMAFDEEDSLIREDHKDITADDSVIETPAQNADTVTPAVAAESPVHEPAEIAAPAAAEDVRTAEEDGGIGFSFVFRDPGSSPTISFTWGIAENEEDDDPLVSVSDEIDTVVGDEGVFVAPLMSAGAHL